jgi:Mlc titration factor MtfA (ptsG expression regulator)
MNDRFQYTIPVVLFIFTIGFTLNNSYDAAFTSFFLMFGFILVGALRQASEPAEEDSSNVSSITSSQHIIRTPFHAYYGDELNFSNDSLIAILTKRFPYFNSLNSDEKERFIERLQKFISQKIFKIHDSNGYKEMPVLVSAAGIQLTFGLEKYLLPNFEYIHIYPEEFTRLEPVICFLQGNVSGRSINLSWKHFLEGYADVTDGQNVGLHELAHALFYQTFVVEENVDKRFQDIYSSFVNDANKVYNTEKTTEGGLYSDYAVTNFQEFWAESAELFFEKPSVLRSYYPRLYETLRSLLNQDPINKHSSMLT